MDLTDRFKNDLTWLLIELKQEEMANAFSTYLIKFRLVYPSDENEPTIRSQRRLLKMLADQNALTLKPFYHGNMSMFDSVFEMQGAVPIGFYIQILQPQFDKVFETVIELKEVPVIVNMENGVALPAPKNDTNNYFISVSSTRKVMLNNTFVLASPNFDTENHQFIEYILNHPNETLSKASIEKDAKIVLKKSFHSTINDLGFSGEIRKIFFEASKTKVKFRNHVPQTQLAELEINLEKLNTELSGLDRNDKKSDDMNGDE
jgi:hypothetical protein